MSCTQIESRNSRKFPARELPRQRKKLFWVGGFSHGLVALQETQIFFSLPYGPVAKISCSTVSNTKWTHCQSITNQILCLFSTETLYIWTLYTSAALCSCIQNYLRLFTLTVTVLVWQCHKAAILYPSHTSYHLASMAIIASMDPGQYILYTWKY